jgi:hypothetical protein
MQYKKEVVKVVVVKLPTAVELFDRFGGFSPSMGSSLSQAEKTYDQGRATKKGKGGKVNCGGAKT